MMLSQETDSNSRHFLDWDSSLDFYNDLVSEYPYIVREMDSFGTTQLGDDLYALHMSYQYMSEVDQLGITDTTEYITDAERPSIIIVGGHYANR